MTYLSVFKLHLPFYFAGIAYPTFHLQGGLLYIFCKILTQVEIDSHLWRCK